MIRVGGGLGEGKQSTRSMLVAPFVLLGPVISYLLVILCSALFAVVNKNEVALAFISLFFIAIPSSYLLGIFPAFITAVLIEARIEKLGNYSFWRASVMGGLSSIIFIGPVFIAFQLSDPKPPSQDFGLSNLMFLLPLFLLGFATTAILMYLTKPRQNRIAEIHGFLPLHKLKA
jgi:hypothetical protein